MIDSLEHLQARKLEHERQVRRGALVIEALRLQSRDRQPRQPLRVRVGSALVRAGGRLQGEHAHPALREVLTGN